MAKSRNTNCLKGVRCPKCKQEDRFYVVGVTTFEVTDDGAVVAENGMGDIEYDSESYAICADCDHHGKWGAFQKVNQRKKKAKE